MTVVPTRIIVREDGSVSLATPLPVGEHVVAVQVAERDVRPRPMTPEDLPKFDIGPWPEGLTIDREWFYGDDDE